MRLRRELIDRIAAFLARGLLHYRYVETRGPEDDLRAKLARVIAEDLRLEDRLNEEVKEILAGYEREMDRGNIDYTRLFNLVKNRLVRERNLIL
jgi:hypothetical protein